MQINLRKTIAEQIGLPNLKKWINSDSWGWKEETFIDLATMDRRELTSLRMVIASAEKVRGVSTLLRDIDTWLETIDNPDSVGSAKPRSPRQFEPLLIRAIGQIPGHRIYKRIDDIDGVFVAFYVEKIEYHTRYESREGVTPEHVTMEIHWEDCQSKKEKTEIFWPEDCKGMPVIESLARKGYFLETPALRKKYLAEMKLWGEVIKQVGKQCLAYGNATDDDVDGNPGDNSGWYHRKSHSYRMGKKEGPTKVLVDIFKEEESKERNRNSHIDSWFWTLTSHKNLIGAESKKIKHPPDDEELLESLDVETPELEIPIHPYLIVFDLKKHLRLKIHISYLADYKYDKAIIDRLILPEELKHLVNMLIEHEEANFQDIVSGKSGGAVVLLCGPPGVGKTLTAEVYAESEERGLYSVQCSQLGVEAKDLEEELLKVFSRARRWGAVLLLDEADVYVKERGGDLMQNAIVGVFLRVLEYQGNVLFLTTNRPDDVDDAVASRCIARLDYKKPSPEDQKKIWRVLADASKVKLCDKTIDQIVSRSEGISGRDVKNLLKLASLLARSESKEITPDMVEFAKKFKPTK